MKGLIVDLCTGHWYPTQSGKEQRKPYIIMLWEGCVQDAGTLTQSGKDTGITYMNRLVKGFVHYLQDSCGIRFNPGTL